MWLCGKNVSQLFTGVSDNHFTASCHMTKLIRIRSASARCGMQYHWRARAKLTKNLSVPNCDLTAQTQRLHCGGNWKSLLAVSDVSLSLQMDPITGQHFLQRSSSSKASKSSEASVSDAACALHKQIKNHQSWKKMSQTTGTDQLHRESGHCSRIAFGVWFF